MKNCLFKQLKEARLEAKRAGVKGLYKWDSTLLVNRNHAFLNGCHRFKLKGLSIPKGKTYIQFPLKKFMGITQMASRITKDYKVKIEEDFYMCIEGKNKTMNFKVRLPYGGA